MAGSVDRFAGLMWGGARGTRAEALAYRSFAAFGSFFTASRRTDCYRTDLLLFVLFGGTGGGAMSSCTTTFESDVGLPDAS